MTTLPSTTPTFIRVRYGHEGPHHDPYSYSEVTIERNGHVALLHYGLGEFVDIDGTTIILNTDNLTRINKMLMRTIGMDITTMAEAQAAYENKPLRCCHRPRLRSTQGYAGECVLYCDNCNTIVAEEDPTSYIL